MSRRDLSLPDDIFNGSIPTIDSEVLFINGLDMFLYAFYSWSMPGRIILLGKYCNLRSGNGDDCSFYLSLIICYYLAIAFFNASTYKL